MGALLFLGMLALIAGCGVIFGDRQASVPLQMAVTFVLGVALGYGFFRFAQHGWRETRRTRRANRRDDRPWNQPKDPPPAPPAPPG
jgi:hypothetical protein